jgi:WhiB family redox-sensing transcriptional regulator
VTRVLSADRGVSAAQPDTWQDRAACTTVDPDLFYPQEAGHAWRGKQVCQRCPVWRDCLADALRTGDRHGIRGGLTDVERAGLTLRQRRAFLGEAS